MFHHHAHAGIHCRRAPIQTLSSLSGCRVFLRGGFFFHVVNVTAITSARINSTNDENSYSMDVIHRQGQNRPEKPRSGFSIPETFFGDDKAEQAKATLHAKQSFYGSEKGTKGHGHAVMPGLSKEAQKRLKASPFSAPISPCKSAYKKSGTPTLVAPSLSVCTPAHLSGGDK